mmetsp:Transcript_19938/g.59254  ORF Transcript_19938/g.59254 Transcript_19938/m.59254 type:complete len:123 (-) Transcript_19938:1553-1921(-)
MHAAQSDSGTVRFGGQTQRAFTTGSQPGGGNGGGAHGGTSTGALSHSGAPSPSPLPHAPLHLRSLSSQSNARAVAPTAAQPASVPTVAARFDFQILERPQFGSHVVPSMQVAYKAQLPQRVM